MIQFAENTNGQKPLLDPGRRQLHWKVLGLRIANVDRTFLFITLSLPTNPSVEKSIHNTLITTGCMWKKSLGLAKTHKR
jgi:hypothetical protein